jgi:hypothetical protein
MLGMLLHQEILPISIRNMVFQKRAKRAAQIGRVERHVVLDVVNDDRHQEEQVGVGEVPEQHPFVSSIVW